MNGLLILDKPAGLTSHDVVSIVRRATGEKSIGHLGTLDPMATGVLPLLLGKYTRLAQFFGQAEKQYTGTIRFGFATDTFDAEGTPVLQGTAAALKATGFKPEDAPLKGTGFSPYITPAEDQGALAPEGPDASQPLDLSLDRLRALATRFHGPIDQLPPIFSAKKINGVPAHKLARAGKEVAVKPARIHIHNFELLSLSGDTATFQMHVSAGGYVRSVAHELGQLAGCGAHLASLRRTQAGAFTLAQSISLDDLKRLTPAEIEARLPHPRSLLPEMPSVTVDEQTAGRIRNGMQVNVPEFSPDPLIKVFTAPRDLLCIARRIAGTLAQPTVVLG
jgi:tRNA pseudouridine55 synthase